MFGGGWPIPNVKSTLRKAHHLSPPLKNMTFAHLCIIQPVFMTPHRALALSETLGVPKRGGTHILTGYMRQTLQQRSGLETRWTHQAQDGWLVT